MKIELYEPAMCCSSGVCGPSVDPVLVKLQETLRLIEEHSAGAVEVIRHNLSSAPMAFVENAAVAELLRTEGNGVLPLTFIDGVLLCKGSYPDAAGFQSALADRGVEVSLEKKGANQSCCCGPKGCC
jgi:hypothetical protein